MSYVLDQFNQQRIELSDLSNTSVYMSSNLKGTAKRKKESTDNGVIGSGLPTFYNECVQLETPFSPGSVYYFHVKIKRLTATQRFYLYLTNYDDVDGEEAKTQYVKTIDVQGGDPNEWTDFEVIFSPLIAFDCILFQLQRVIDDYRDATRYPRIIYEELSEINNLITDKIGYGIELVKIGVQSHPGLVMCINNEEIKIGRSGIYEIRNGIITVNFFSVVQAAEENIEGSNPLKINGKSVSLDVYLNGVAAELDVTAGSATNSKCIFSNSKLRSMDAFVLDYMYKEGED